MNTFKLDIVFPYTDQVAIPDYPSGATEHWGLITYREDRLLYDPDNDRTSQKETVAGIVAHELAHNVCIALLYLIMSAFNSCNIQCNTKNVFPILYNLSVS